MLELNNIYNCDCLEGLRQMEDNSVDLTVTSCPYDNLRKYTDENKGECEWNFDIFKPIADELFRVTKKGGVVVWVVGDACVNGGETGSSFRQALYFQNIGFKIHDTMIYEKNSSSFPARIDSQRYTQIFEYMFVFTKGKIRKDIKLIADKRNKWAGWTNWGQHSQYDAEGNRVKTNNIKPIAEFSLRNNIWKYSVSFNDKTGHPAVFPEKLAEDHILSWSNEGDVVLDPFMGSGTTAKMAMLNNRKYIGFERNTGYWEESLKRVGKYNGQINTNVSGVTWTDEKGVQGLLQFTNEEDAEFEGKLALWKELTAELEEKFNTQSLGILKNLKVNLSYASKANDKRVQAVLNEKSIEEVPFPTADEEPVFENKISPEEFAEFLELTREEARKEEKAAEERQKNLQHGSEEEWEALNEALTNNYRNPLIRSEIEAICDERIEKYFSEKFMNASAVPNDVPVMLYGMSGSGTESPQLTEDENQIAGVLMDSEPVPTEPIVVRLGSVNDIAKKRRGRPKGSKNKHPKSKMPDYVPVLIPKTDDGGDYISEPRVKTDGGSGVGIEELGSIKLKIFDGNGRA